MQLHTAGILLFKAFPFVEKFVFTAESTDFGVMAVAQDEKSVVVKKLRDGILIVGEIVGVGILDIYVDGFEFHEEQRNTVDKADNIGAAAVESTVDFEFFDSEKMVVERILKINEFCGAGGDFAIGEFDGYRNTVADEKIFLLVDLHKGGRSKMSFEFLLGFINLNRSHPGIELLQFETKIS